MNKKQERELARRRGGLSGLARGLALGGSCCDTQTLRKNDILGSPVLGGWQLWRAGQPGESWQI